jgi:hypothetical protein
MTCAAFAVGTREAVAEMSRPAITADRHTGRSAQSASRDRFAVRSASTTVA